MGVIITKREDIKAYFDSKAVGQSSLKSLTGGLDSFLDNQYKDEEETHYTEKGHFIIGSGVDSKLTGEEDDFDKEYYVSTIDKKPSDTEMAMIHYVLEDVMDSYTPSQLEEEGLEPLQAYLGSIQAASEEFGWYNGKPGEKRIQGLIERCSLYFEDLKAAYGKQVVSKEQADIIDGIVMSLRTHPRTAHFFDRETQQMNTNVDFYYQLPIYFNYKDIDCKALLDLVIVVKDEQGRIASVQPIDLKTMSGRTIDFMTSLKSRRYDIQAAWYTMAIQHWMSELGLTLGEYTLHPFKFIVESTTIQGNPLIFICDESLLEMGKTGRPELDNVCIAKEDIHDIYTIKYNEIKGYEQLIEDYLFYEEQGWKEEKVVEQNEGVLKIDWNGIIN